jgi:hypothetical protein
VVARCRAAALFNPSCLAYRVSIRRASAGHMTREAKDQVTDGDFAVLQGCGSPEGQRRGERALAVREHCRWSVHPRRKWIR